jgi:hypothetical protein
MKPRRIAGDRSAQSPNPGRRSRDRDGTEGDQFPRKIREQPTYDLRMGFQCRQIFRGVSKCSKTGGRVKSLNVDGHPMSMSEITRLHACTESPLAQGLFSPETRSFTLVPDVDEWDLVLPGPLRSGARPSY